MGPITDDVKARFEAMFGVRIQKSFGITETLLCCHWNDALDTPVDSVGKPLPGVEIHIVGEDELPLAAGQEGEIRIGGQWVLDEYWRQPEITAASFDAQKHYKTGDLGRVDAAGHVFITGRIKDMLKCGGLNVSPAEVEAVILRMDGVCEAAVFGVPDEFYGEKIIACVSAMPGRVLDSQAVLAHCRAGLAALKVPSAALLYEALPQNAVGKVDKRALKQAYLAQLKQGAA
jgi:acyl-CoA synthetase (AMP-forming)/AMP-acid ligase II